MLEALFFTFQICCKAHVPDTHSAIMYFGESVSFRRSGQIPVQTMIYCCSNGNLETSLYGIETKDKVVYCWCVMDETSPG